MNILVAGGAGYIGSHAIRQLLKANHSVTVLDNLSHGHVEAIHAAGHSLDGNVQFVQTDIDDTARVIEILKENAVEAVIHFAAFIEVGESVTDPSKYYRNNFTGSLALLDAMRLAKVNKLVFSSTAAVYGNPTSVP